MRTIDAIRAILPELATDLSLMYSDLVKESFHKINVNKDNFFKADLYFQAITRELNCTPDVERLNFYLNEFISIVKNCKRPVLSDTDTIILKCDVNQPNIKFWVPDETECEVSNFSIYATITSFTVPDLVSGYLNGVIELILLAESGGHKQFIQVEKSFADDNPLSSVYYWNESIQAYMPLNKIADWTSSTITKMGVDYIQYTYTGPNRGTSKTKFVL